MKSRPFDRQMFFEHAAIFTGAVTGVLALPISIMAVPAATGTQHGMTERAHFTYEHDFGDSWTHRIDVRTIAPAADRAGSMPAPLLVDGRPSAVPEDCGGPPR